MCTFIICGIRDHCDGSVEKTNELGQFQIVKLNITELVSGTLFAAG